MRASLVLRQWCIRATLFTRPNCSLCDEAKHVLDKVWKRRPFEYTEVDILKLDHQKWKKIYEFDVPVVHVDKVKENTMHFETDLRAGKLMHRFTESDFGNLMDREMIKGSDDGPPEFR